MALTPNRPTQPDCNGCVFPGNCPCFDAREVTVPAEALRVVLHWAVMGGAKDGLYAVRKAVRDAEEALGVDWMESANTASLAALNEAQRVTPKPF